MDSLLDQREKRYKRRKEDKKRFDKAIDLSYGQNIRKLAVPVKKLSDTRIRLLDEGAVVGDGYIDFFIQKGTIEKYLNGENQHLDNITDDYVGNVNLGHIDFAIFPYIIGNWTRKDLHLVDIENDRKAVDVDLHLDEESIFVKELARQPYDIGVSAEFYYHVNEEASKELQQEMEDDWVEVIDEICISAYGLVGECGNVNSDGLELKGGQEMTEAKKLTIEEVEELTSEEAEEQVEELPEAELAIDADEEETEEETEEVAEEETEDAEDKCDGDCEGDCDGCTGEAEEAIVDEVEPEEEEDDEDEGEEGELSILNEAFEQLKAQNEALAEENKALKKTNKKMSKRLATQKAEIAEFTEKFKGLSVSLGFKEEEKKVENKPYLSDGIGD